MSRQRFIDEDDYAYRKSSLPGYGSRSTDGRLTADDIDCCIKYVRWLGTKYSNDKYNKMLTDVGLPPIHRTPVFLKEQRGKEIYRRVLADISRYFDCVHTLEGERDQVRRELYRRQKELTTPRSTEAKRATVQFSNVQKFVSGGQRSIRGVASSIAMDRAGDIVVPRGGFWQTPLPLLWQHMHDKPIGAVHSVEVKGEEIWIEASIVEGVEKADECWRLIEAGVIDSFSIGFNPLESTRMENGGVRFDRWELLEVSCVSVPCNSDAKIRRNHGGVSIVRSGSARDHALRNGAVCIRRGGGK